MTIRAVYNYIETCLNNNWAFFDNLNSLQTFTKYKEYIEQKNLIISYDTSDILEELNKDISDYSDDEPVWIYMKETNNTLIPYDYMLCNYDLLDEEDIHFETSLKYAEVIFQITENILEDITHMINI
ncbi:MAG: hypothetical protein LUG60_06935 [Erysipelotrichaceae bacterium]|nr:hypothetical protein [Erysipelotrichaceae bacterium]